MLAKSIHLYLQPLCHLITFQFLVHFKCAFDETKWVIPWLLGWINRSHGLIYVCKCDTKALWPFFTIKLYVMFIQTPDRHLCSPCSKSRIIATWVYLLKFVVYLRWRSVLAPVPRSEARQCGGALWREGEIRSTFCCVSWPFGGSRAEELVSAPVLTSAFCWTTRTDQQGAVFLFVSLC